MQFNSFSLEGASNQVSNTVTSLIFCGVRGVTSSFCVSPVWSAQLCHRDKDLETACALGHEIQSTGHWYMLGNDVML